MRRIDMMAYLFIVVGSFSSLLSSLDGRDGRFAISETISCGLWSHHPKIDKVPILMQHCKRVGAPVVHNAATQV